MLNRSHWHANIHFITVVVLPMIGGLLVQNRTDTMLKLIALSSPVTSKTLTVNKVAKSPERIKAHNSTILSLFSSSNF